MNLSKSSVSSSQFSVSHSETRDSRPKTISQSARRSEISRTLHGALWLDALLSIIPLLLIVFYTLNISAIIVEKSAHSSSDQILFDNLVSVSDYNVKQMLAKKTEHVVWPNLVEGLSAPAGGLEELRTGFGLKALSIGPDKADGTCIYRLVVLEDAFGLQSIEKIYVCGG